MTTTDNIIQDRAYWRQHIEQWQQTNLTQAAYCRENQLCPDKFSYYKRTKAGKTKTRNLTSTGFVSVQVKQESHSDGLTLNFANGMSLSGIDEHNLAVVKQLAGILS